MITTGTIGQATRLTIDPAGTIVGAGSPLGWYVAAEDRWHDPRTDSGVRQTRLSGTPVVETRVRVHGGDVIQRIYSVADFGGITVIEVANESTLPVAVAFDRGDVLTERPRSRTAVEGIDLPEGSFVVPIGHRSSVRVGLAHHHPAGGELPDLPSCDEVVKGWVATSDRAGRIDVPSPHLVDALVSARCDTALAVSLDDDPARWLLGLDQQHRMGLIDARQLESVTVDVAEAVAAIGPTSGWLPDAALAAAGRVLVAAGESRAAADLLASMGRRRSGDLGTTVPDDAVGLGLVAFVERMMVRDADLLPLGLPPAWVGQSFECHGLPTVAGSAVSYAIRWHGERPAVLWEQVGVPVRLQAPRIDPTWCGPDESGEALWPPIESANQSV